MIQLAQRQRCTLFGLEVDIIRDESRDLLQEQLWEDIRQLIQEADALFMAPPCNTFSRARNHYVDGGGPRPIRMQDYPYGFPWLSHSDRQVAEAANVLVLRSFELAKLAIMHGVKFALEHPEQLGLVKGLVPGSIWDFEEFHEILETSSSTTFAFHQCQFQATSSKTTRILQCGVQWSDAVVHDGLPQLDADGRYLGPLPRACGHVRPPLLGKDEQSGKWKSAASAAYNARMCSWLASALLRPTRLTGGGKGGRSESERPIRVI